MTNTNNEKYVEVVHSDSNKDKKIVSLTTGFSIRRNSNNTNNPYTLTVLTRPFDDFDKGNKNSESDNSSRDNPNRYFYETSSESSEKPADVAVLDNSQYAKSSERNMRRKDSRYKISDDFDIPVYIRPKSRSRSKTAKVKSTTTPSTSTTKYYLKSVVKRPAPFSTDNKNTGDSVENSADNLQSLIDKGLQNARDKIEPTSTTDRIVEITPKKEQSLQSRWVEPTVSPYNNLDRLRNIHKQESLIQDSTTSTAPTPRFTTTTSKDNVYINSRDRPSHSKSSYYSYRIEAEEVPDHTTEVFSSSVKNVIKAFFNTVVSTPVPQRFSSTSKPASLTSKKPEQKIVNIGFQIKPVKYTDEKPTRHNLQRLKIITEPTSTSRYVALIPKQNVYIQTNQELNRDVSTTTTTMTPMDSVSYVYTTPGTTPISRTSSIPENSRSFTDYQSKFSSFMPTQKIISETTPQLIEPSRKFQNIIKVEPTSAYFKNDDIDNAEFPVGQPNVESTKTSEIDWHIPAVDVISEIASTTSTTKSTSTLTATIDPTTKLTTKSVSYPTRASRINPAIKLAASNPASGRRSYQSSSKCSSDNSLQENPKCNEIKYQRYFTRRPVA